MLLSVVMINGSPTRSAWLRLLFLVLAAIPLGPACALPMGSQGTWMIMGDFGGYSDEFAANYAVTRRDAFGMSASRWEDRERDHGPGGEASRRDFAGLTYTRQVNRWNLPHAQGNLWLVGTLGRVRPRERSGDETLGGLSLLADYETTRVYGGAGVMAKRASGIRHDTAYVRAGFSFYEVEYEEVQPWFILEAKHDRFSADTRTSVMPMLRFIHRRYFVEMGANRDKAILRFMLTY